MSEPTAEANEADRLEQETPVRYDDVGDRMGPELSALDANEADVVEQHLEVPPDDDDYEG